MVVFASGFRSIALRLIVTVGGTAALLFVAAILYSYGVSRSIVLEEAEQRALLTAEAQANDLEEVLRSVEEGARLLGSTLEHTDVTRPELEAIIESFVAGNPKIYGSAVALAPERSRYAPYFHRAGGSIVRTDLASEDGRYWERDGYRSAASSMTPRWSEPAFDEAGGHVLLVKYFVPVRDAEGLHEVRGVVTAELSLEWLSDVVESRESAFGGYAVILSRDGRILAHPDPQLRDSPVTALEAAQPGIDPRVRDIVAQMLEGRSGFEPFDDLYLGERARAAFRPIEGSGWSFAVVYPEAALLEGVRSLARDQLLILGVGLVALVGLVAVASRRVTRPLSELSASAGEIATGHLDAELPEPASRDEVGRLTLAFHHMRDSLKDYIHDLEVTTKAKERLESELEIARRIQMDMLPPPEAGGRGTGYELAATLVPARHVGGDLYDHFLLEDDLFFFVGDVSGKGVAAALFMARAKTMLQAEAAHEPDLAALLDAVNRSLCQDNEQGMFVTLLAGRLNVATGALLLAGAGHDPPLLRPGSGGPPRFLELEGGPVLGLLEGAAYRSMSAQLAAGDALVLFTDGVSEALDAHEDFFTAERLLEHVRALPRGSASELTRGVLAAVKSFAGTAPQSDDITVMTVRFTAGRGREPRRG